MESVYEVLEAAGNQFSSNYSHKYRINGHFSKITYGELFETVRYFRQGLHLIGVKQYDHVALFSDNRVEWIIADLAILSLERSMSREGPIQQKRNCYILQNTRIHDL